MYFNKLIVILILFIRLCLKEHTIGWEFNYRIKSKGRGKPDL
jgi:hypothetical protein